MQHVNIVEILWKTSSGIGQVECKQFPPTEFLIFEFVSRTHVRCVLSLAGRRTILFEFITECLCTQKRQTQNIIQINDTLSIHARWHYFNSHQWMCQIFLITKHKRCILWYSPNLNWLHMYEWEHRSFSMSLRSMAKEGKQWHTQRANGAQRERR